MYRKTTATIAVTFMVISIIATLGVASGALSSDQEWTSTGNDTINVADGTSMITEVTLTNGGSAAIDNIRMIFPSGTTNLNTTGVVPVENGKMDTVTDNVVTLEAGTTLTLNSENTVSFSVDTAVMELAGENVYNPAAGENVNLNENGDFTVGAGENTILGADNVFTSPASQNLTMEGDNTIELLEDTQVITHGDNVIELPETTAFEIPVGGSRTVTGIGTDENIVISDSLTVNLHDNNVTAAEDISVTTASGYTQTLSEGQSVELTGDNDVISYAGTKFQLNDGISATIAENTQVTKPANDKMKVQEGFAITNQPAGWTQSVGTSDLPSGEYVEWTGSLPAGESISLPVALTTPSEGDYTIYTRVKSGGSSSLSDDLTMSVDGTNPTISSITASPTWVNGGTEVGIEITASETLSTIGTVLVTENNNTGGGDPISLTPNDDNTVWTGTYTTYPDENKNLDGEATVSVTEAADLVGNTISDSNTPFTVDRLAPPVADLTSMAGWPTDQTDSPTVQTNVADTTLENIAQDNNYHGIVNLAGGTVEITVGDSSATKTTDAGGFWSYNLSLSEGLQEVGLQVTDLAGNKSVVSRENVMLDTTPPSFSFGAPGDGAVITDNAPTISVDVSDPGIGFENAAYDSSDMSGLSVGICEEENVNHSSFENLWASTTASGMVNSFTYENTYPSSGLADGEWYVFAIAGDNLQSDNAWYSFTVDTTPPGGVASSDGTGSDATSEDTAPTVTTSSVSVTGTASADATTSVETVNIYVNGSQVGSSDVASDLSFTGTIPLEAGMNKIELSTVDAAGHESTKSLYGYVDYSIAPTVDAPVKGSMASPGMTIKENSIHLTGSGAPDTTVNVYIGGEVATTADVSSDGSWSTAVSLPDGISLVQVSAEYAGYETAKTNYGYVASDTTSPTATINSPDEGATTSDVSITVEAEVTDDITASEDITVSVRSPAYTVPEQEVSVASDGELVVDVPLAEDQNTISIIAEDEAGNKDITSVTVTRKVSEALNWAMYATFAAIIAIILAAIAIIRRPS
uniref:Cable pili-associated 22 kDa adhesin protein n=1 Tax=uncultured organism TaxID=155900 RepID=M1PVC6_9ZZZZ|nr:cable pili-associated 22 kDa adhesin protein [uncultured organism]